MTVGSGTPPAAMPAWMPAAIRAKVASEPSRFRAVGDGAVAELAALARIALPEDDV